MWIIILVGIFYLVAGTLFQFRPVIEWYVARANTFKGVPTEITPKTIKANRLSAFILVIAGVFFIFYALFHY